MKTYKEMTEEILLRAKNIKGKRIRKRIITWSLCAALLLSLNLFLFIPIKDNATDIKQYRGTEYYNLISKLNPVTNTVKADFGNNFQRIAHYLSNVFKSKSAEVDYEPKNENTEITNNQADNVTEGDLIKRDGNYIYYLKINFEGIQLDIYTLDGSSSSLVTEYTVVSDYCYEYDMTKFPVAEMYLYANKIVIAKNITVSEESKTSVIILDVSNPQEIKEENRFYISGFYVSSRIVDGKLITISDYMLNNNIDYDDKSEYIPSITVNGVSRDLSMSEIKTPDAAKTGNYIVIDYFDIISGKNLSDMAFLSYTGDIYVSAENIYLTYSYNAYYKNKNNVDIIDKTDVSCVNFGSEALKLINTVTIDGVVNDQYSMDEYEGIFRLVTTCRKRSRKIIFGFEKSTLTETECNIYAFDINDLSERGKLLDFAPEYETVKSVRFDKNKVYIVSYIQTDPVFVFDLSDYSDIKKIGELSEIPGYSTNLITYIGGTLLGIGYGAGNNLNIAIYNISENEKLEIIDNYTENCEFPHKFKAYMIDKINNYIGMCVYSNGEYNYLLLRYENKKLVLKAEINLSAFRSILMENGRAVYVNGYIYIFTNNAVTVLDGNYNIAAKM